VVPPFVEMSPRLARATGGACSHLGHSRFVRRNGPWAGSFYLSAFPPIVQRSAPEGTSAAYFLRNASSLRRSLPVKKALLTCLHQCIYTFTDYYRARRTRKQAGSMKTSKSHSFIVKQASETMAPPVDPLSSILDRW